jgi:hypothetical protein
MNALKQPRYRRLKIGVFLAVVASEVALLGVAIMCLLSPLVDPHVPGYVQGRGSPLWFWLARRQPLDFFLIGAACLASLVPLEWFRRALVNVWPGVLGEYR